MADSGNDSDVDYSCLFTKQYTLINVSILTPMIIVTAFGNCLILACLFRFRSAFQGSLYILIGNLAIADLVLCAGSMLILIEFIFQETAQNMTFCLIKSCLIFCSLAVSGATIMLMSVDRFMAVAHPMKHLVKSKRHRIFYSLTAVTWIMALSIICVPTLLKADPSSTIICRIGPILPPILNYISPMSLLFEFGFNTIMFLIVYYKLKRVSADSIRVNKSKSTKFTVTVLVFIAFMLCWFPFVIVSLLMIADDSITRQGKYECVRDYAGLLGMVNSSFNWIIYGVSYKKINDAFKRMLCCFTYKPENIIRNTFSPSLE